MCKKMKVFPEPYILKHYLDGEWNKDYNRRETVASMVNFMRDPSGDLPWDEDSTATDILHIPDNNVRKNLNVVNQGTGSKFQMIMCRTAIILY